MQISSLSEDQQVALAVEASKLTAFLEAACTLEATPVEEESTVTFGQISHVTILGTIRGCNMWNHHVASPTNWIAYLTTVEEVPNEVMFSDC